MKKITLFLSIVTLGGCSSFFGVDVEISGRVTESGTDLPASNVSVTLTSGGSSLFGGSSYEEYGTVTTDGSGNYKIDAELAGGDATPVFLDISFQSTGYTYAAAEIMLTEEQRSDGGKITHNQVLYPK